MAFGSLFGGKNVARDGAADGTQEVLALGQRLCPLAGSEQCQRGAADVAQAGILNPEVAQALVGLNLRVFFQRRGALQTGQCRPVQQPGQAAPQSSSSMVETATVGASRRTSSPNDAAWAMA